MNWISSTTAASTSPPPSVYMGALLKGGIVGLLLLLAIIACGLWQAWRKRHTDSRYSLAILFYALVFMASQDVYHQQSPGNGCCSGCRWALRSAKGWRKNANKRAVSGPFILTLN